MASGVTAPPAVNPNGFPHPRGPPCGVCQRNKVLCDRGRPCSTCVRTGVPECFYMNGSNRPSWHKTRNPSSYPEPPNAGDVAVYGPYPASHAPQASPAAPSSAGSFAPYAAHFADATDGGPGRDGARLAWRAAVTYGGTHVYGDDFEPLDIDGTENLFEDADRSHARGGGAGGGGARGRGRGGWRRLLKGTEHEDIGRNPAASVRGRPRLRTGKGVRGGRRSKPVDPGHQFKMLMQTATKAYFELDYDTAADYCRQAIAVNPEIFGAHSLLSAVLQDQGRREESLEVLKIGAVTTRSAQIWEALALKLLDVPPQQRTRGLLRDALECYSEAIKVTRPESAQFHLRAAKYELYKELNDSKASRLDCKNILRIWPHKTYYIKEFAQLCAAWHDRSELKRAMDEYDSAFKMYQDQESFGDEDDPTDQWSHLNTYLELAEMVGRPLDSIMKAKEMARWFLGRQKDTFWNRCSEDDREFDLDNARRHLVPEWQQGKCSLDPILYGEGLPIEIRVRLGMLRMKMGVDHYPEALRHFRPLLDEAEAIEDFLEVFLQVAQALRAAGHVQEAAEFYDCVRNFPDAVSKIYGLDEKTWMLLATCYQAARRIDDAIACYEVVVGRLGDNYNRASGHLARLYEETGELDKARYIVDEFINKGRHDVLLDAGVQMVPEEVRGRPANIPIPVHVPSGKPTPAIKPRIERQPPKPLLPAGAAPGSQAPQLFPSPISRPPPPLPRQPIRNATRSDPRLATAVPTTKPIELLDRKRSTGRMDKKRRRDHILEEICEEIDGPELAEEETTAGSSSQIKRPRLTKKPKTISKAESRRQRIDDTQTRVSAYHDTVRTLWTEARDGQDESARERWMEAAFGMLVEFAAMKAFFPYRDKKKGTDQDQGPRAHANGPVSAAELYSIHFQDWHRVFVDMALFYARNAEQDRCYKILQDVLFGANVFFQRPKLKWTQYAAAIHCAHVFNDSQYLNHLGRELIKDGDYRSGEGYQLFACLNRLSYGSNWFNAGPTQKFMLRQVKALDFYAMSPAMREHYDWSAQAPTLRNKVDDVADEEASDLYPGVLLTYGHMVAVSNHSFSALPYYYRALALQPDNICINLSIATMWVQNSMKRQTANRHHGITQGLAFLHRYHDLRVASGRACHRQEAEFNTARMWHYLGLTSLAVPAYEAVLALSPHVHHDARRDDATSDPRPPAAVEDYAPEAAFALQGIYALAGNDRAAQAVTEAWLVI